MHTRLQYKYNLVCQSNCNFAESCCNKRKYKQYKRALYCLNVPFRLILKRIIRRKILGRFWSDLKTIEVNWLVGGLTIEKTTTTTLQHLLSTKKSVICFLSSFKILLQLLLPFSRWCFGSGIKNYSDCFLLDNIFQSVFSKQHSSPFIMDISN